MSHGGVLLQQEPHHRRLAFDLGDVGIGQLTNSLELGCDCLGHIHYFDAVLNNSKGQPPNLLTTALVAITMNIVYHNLHHFLIHHTFILILITPFPAGGKVREQLVCTGHC